MAQCSSGTGSRSIFICGLARSGTTWLADALGQSEKLVNIREVWLLERLKELLDWQAMVHDNWDGFTPWKAQGLDPSEFLSMTADFYGAVLDRLAGGQRHVEKTPDWNGKHLPILRRMFPEARFIVLVRDGRNYVASMEGKRKRDKTAFDFSRECKRWSSTMKVLRLELEHPCGNNFKLLRYEDLVEDFDHQFRSVCDFVKIPKFKPAAFYPNSAFRGSVDLQNFNHRWATWGKRQHDLFNRHCGEELAAWNYR